MKKVIIKTGLPILGALFALSGIATSALGGQTPSIYFFVTNNDPSQSTSVIAEAYLGRMGIYDSKFGDVNRNFYTAYKNFLSDPAGHSASITVEPDAESGTCNFASFNVDKPSDNGVAFVNLVINPDNHISVSGAINSLNIQLASCNP